MATLTPAYGRDYKNKAEVLQALGEQSDFVLNDMSGNRYVSMQELLDAGVSLINVRYNKLKTVLCLDIRKIPY